MITVRNVIPYIVSEDAPMLEALQKMSMNRSGHVFLVNERGILTGVFSDGDFRRAVIDGTWKGTATPVRTVAGVSPVAASIDADPAGIQGLFSEKIRVVPLVDGNRRLVAVAMAGAAKLMIGDKELAENAPSYVIAEIGNNHNGSLDLACRLVDAAAAAGADCAKFQMRQLDKLYRTGSAEDEDLGVQYTQDLLRRFSLSNDDLLRVFDYCHKRGIEPLCTPWDDESVDILEGYGLAAYKTASADLTNHGLLRRLAATRKPLICSTGMSSEAEIREAVDVLRAAGSGFVLLHCNATYPAPFKDINLGYMTRLARLGGCLVGYSGHERGINVAVAAVGLGAKVIEKHFTLDRAMEGNDHKVSLLPDEFAAMVTGIREVEESLGHGEERTISQGEMMNRENLAKSLVAARPIRAGSLIGEDDVIVRSPGRGLQPNRRDALIGTTARRDFAAFDFFYPSDLARNADAAPRKFTFDRPWGVPVRYHDFASVADLSNPDLLEFHLSYQDLTVDFRDLIQGPQPYTLVVHAPELFAHDHLLDLCAADDAARDHSIAELQKVINLTRDLAPLFKDNGPVPLIVNVGGFTEHRHLSVADRQPLYDRLAKSLESLDTRDVDLLPQTMPPFPWHFGGQRYHNLFLAADEIVAFCKRMDLGICLDTSHSKLTCTFYQWSFSEFCEQVGPFVRHLHLADAKGVDGEGLQIGEGDLDFAPIAEILGRRCPDASFIPEVWQGHKDSGSGFWLACNRLEKWFRPRNAAGSADGAAVKIVV